MMMALGMFVFSMDTAPFSEIQRRTGWRHGLNSRVGARPAGQFAGPGDDLITLPGTIAYGVLTPPGALDELRAMGDRGQAWPLVDGAGHVYGAFVIEGLDETRRALWPDGTPRMSDFTLSLRRMDDDGDFDPGAASPSGVT